MTTPSIQPVRWGILGAARIAQAKIIPALLASPACRVQAIGARELPRAQALAARFGIPSAYGSYEAVLDDPLVEAVYIALPNHLHVHWARAAAARGKHVLCEKPMAMQAEELAGLAELAGDRLVSEAFMVRHQPRWLALRETLRSGRYGAPKTVHSLLSFFMDNPQDFRHTPAFGGGALYDLGCYTVMAARYVFEQEPLQVMALAALDPVHGVDTFSTAILDFGAGRHAAFTVSTAMASSQTLHVVCERGYIDLPKAYVPPRDGPALLEVDVSASHDLSDLTATPFDAVDQYACEVNNFARAVRGEAELVAGVHDALANARVMDALFASLRSGRWTAVAA